MSKKVIPFAVPAPQRPKPEAASQPASGDAWVMATAPEMPEAAELEEQRFVIDLSERRTWPQLVGLIWAFPVVATMMWTAQLLELSSRSGGRR